MLVRAVLVATLVALLATPAAVAHGGGAARGYASSVTALTPATEAVHVAVLDADDRLQLRVEGPHTVLIRGYEGEPYLRFAPDGVFRNEASPATYLNDDRYGDVELPASADPKAPPRWELVAPGGRAYAWHDHRIHWMSPSYPPVVEADPSMVHHIFDWKVAGTFDGAPLAIAGSLDYRPPPGQGFPRVLLVPLVLLVLAAAGVAWLRLRRRAPSARA